MPGVLEVPVVNWMALKDFLQKPLSEEEALKLPRISPSMREPVSWTNMVGLWRKVMAARKELSMQYPIR